MPNKLHNLLASIAIVTFTLVGLTGILMMTVMLSGFAIYEDLT